MDDVLNAPETMTKVAMYNEEVDAAVGAEEAKRRFGDKIQIMASGDYWVDFVDVHSGKGNALQKLCNRLGITKREEVVAFGDNCNDVTCCWKLERAMQLLLPARKPSRPPDTYWRNQVRTAY